MAIFLGGSKIGKIYLGNQPIKKVYQGAQLLYSSGVQITFVEGGVSTTVEYEEGAVVNRRTAPEGATFVGWSTSSSGTNPVSTFTATQNATYYRVVKYNDYRVATITHESATTYRGPFTVDANKYTFKLGVFRHGGLDDLETANAELGTDFFWGGPDGDEPAVRNVYAVLHSDGTTDEVWKYLENITPQPNSYLITSRPQGGYWASGTVDAIGKTVVG